MMIQVTAYEALGGLQVHAIKADASPAGYQWTQLVSELASLPSWYDGDVWDALWVVGGLLQERAIERGNGPSQPF